MLNDVPVSFCFVFIYIYRITQQRTIAIRIIVFKFKMILCKRNMLGVQHPIYMGCSFVAVLWCLCVCVGFGRSVSVEEEDHVESVKRGSVAVDYPDLSFDVASLTANVCTEFPTVESPAEVEMGDLFCRELSEKPAFGGIILEAAVEQCATLFSCGTKLGLREAGEAFVPSRRDGWHAAILKRTLACAAQQDNANFSSSSHSRISGYTALHLAVLFQLSWAVEAISHLSTVDADASASFDPGFLMSPLHLAAINQDAESARILIKNGATVFSKDAFGRTPIDIAVAVGANSVVSAISKFYPEYCPAADSDSDSERSAAESLDKTIEAHRDDGGWRVNGSRTVSTSGIPLTSLLTCGLEKVDARTVTADEILKNYISIGKPFIMTHALDDWPPRTLWTRNAFLEKHGNYEVTAGTIPYAQVFNGSRWGVASVREFAEYMERDWFAKVPEADPKLYIFDAEILNDSLDECPLPLHFGAFFTQHYSHFTQFILGPPDSGAPQHFHSDAINCLAFGRKYWVLLAPSRASYLKEHPLAWMLRQDKVSAEGMHGCLQKAGEIMYAPRFWGHSVINFDQSISVAFEFDRGAEC